MIVGFESKHEWNIHSNRLTFSSKSSKWKSGKAFKPENYFTFSSKMNGKLKIMKLFAIIRNCSYVLVIRASCTTLPFLLNINSNIAYKHKTKLNSYLENSVFNVSKFEVVALNAKWIAFYWNRISYCLPIYLSRANILLSTLSPESIFKLISVHCQCTTNLTWFNSFIPFNNNAHHNIINFSFYFSFFFILILNRKWNGSLMINLNLNGKACML